MATKTVVSDIPTRGSINELFRELSQRHGYEVMPEWVAFRKLDDEYDRLVDAFRESPKMVAMHKEIQRLRRIAREKDERIKAKIQSVRQLYLASGLTPAVGQKIRDLVNELHEDTNGKATPKGKRRRKGR